MEVRLALPADAAQLLLLVAEYCEADGHEFDGDLAALGLSSLLHTDRHGVVLVAESATEGCVGYAAVTWGWSIECGGLEAVLDELYVRRRGEGIGSELIRAVEATCRDRAVRRVFLETELPNERARLLYARHGFQTESSVWMSKLLR